MGFFFVCFESHRKVINIGLKGLSAGRLEQSTTISWCGAHEEILVFQSIQIVRNKQNSMCVPSCIYQALKHGPHACNF